MYGSKRHVMDMPGGYHKKPRMLAIKSPSPSRATLLRPPFLHESPRWATRPIRPFLLLPWATRLPRRQDIRDQGTSKGTSNPHQSTITTATTIGVPIEASVGATAAEALIAGEAAVEVVIAADIAAEAVIGAAVVIGAVAAGVAEAVTVAGVVTGEEVVTVAGAEELLPGEKRTLAPQGHTLTPPRHPHQNLKYLTILLSQYRSPRV